MKLFIQTVFLCCFFLLGVPGVFSSSSYQEKAQNKIDALYSSNGLALLEIEERIQSLYKKYTPLDSSISIFLASLLEYIVDKKEEPSCNRLMRVDTNFKDGDIWYRPFVMLHGGTYHDAEVMIEGKKISVSDKGTYEKKITFKEGKNQISVEINVPSEGCHIKDEITIIHQVPVCGDGILSNKDKGRIHGENCDDGNTIDGDGCNSSCRKENVIYDTSSGAGICGDGIIQSHNSFGNHETCDDGNNNNWDGCNMRCQISENIDTVAGNTPDIRIMSAKITKGNIKQNMEYVQIKVELLGKNIIKLKNSRPAYSGWLGCTVEGKNRGPVVSAIEITADNANQTHTLSTKSDQQKQQLAMYTSTPGKKNIVCTLSSKEPEYIYNNEKNIEIDIK